MLILTLIGSLALASIPLVLGWRRTAGEAAMARALGLSLPTRRFDPEKFARQTGAGLSFNQLLYGFLIWLGGGAAAGWALGPLATILFAAAGALMYYGSLANRRQEVRLQQAKDVLRGLGVIETLLRQGRPLSQALEESAGAVGSAGRVVLEDLVYQMRVAPADRAAEAVRTWTQAWDSPAVDIVGTALLAALEGRIEIAPLIASLRETLSAVVEVLARARAAAKGIEWQVRFLALFPPGVLVMIAVTTPEVGRLYGANPLLALPVLLGSGASYLLSMRMLRSLSIEASLGLQAGKRAGLGGEVRLDRSGRAA